MAEDPAGTLCLACGLCCTGAIFERVPADRAETRALAGAGIVFWKKTPQATDYRFSQPCPCHRDGACGVYDSRPATCRRYRCRLLKAVMRGAVPPDEAEALVRDVVAETRALEARARALGIHRKGASLRRVLRDFHASDPAPDPALRDFAARAAAYLQVLDSRFQRSSLGRKIAAMRVMRAG